MSLPIFKLFFSALMLLNVDVNALFNEHFDELDLQLIAGEFTDDVCHIAKNWEVVVMVPSASGCLEIRVRSFFE